MFGRQIEIPDGLIERWIWDHPGASEEDAVQGILEDEADAMWTRHEVRLEMMEGRQ